MAEAVEALHRSVHGPETPWPTARPKSAPVPTHRPLGPTKRGRRRIDWDPEELAAAPPAELARRYGVTESAVCKARQRFGVEGPDRRK